MTPSPIVVPPAEPIGRCARRIDQHGVRHLPVVDDQGALLGLVTDALVWRRGAMVGVRERTFVAYDERDEVLTAADLASGVDVVLTPDTPLDVAVRALLGTSQDVAVVVEEGRVVGILTEHDLVRFAVGALPEGLCAGHVGRKDVVAVASDTPVAAAWDRMTEARVRHLVVADGAGVDGVLSIRDLLADEADRRDSSLVAGDLVRRRPPLTATAETPLREVAAILARDHVGLLPILDDGRLVGVVSRTDVARALLVAVDDEGLFPGA